MIYRPLLPETGPYTISSFSDGRHHAATIPIGEDDDPARVYSVLVSLDPVDHLMPGAAGAFELTFCIVELDAEHDHEHHYWSGTETKGKLVGIERDKCVQVILSAIRVLLAETSPDHVFMQTCDANLPLTAREKYERIIQVFIECGYLVEHQEPYHGRDSWWMERTEA